MESSSGVFFIRIQQGISICSNSGACKCHAGDVRMSLGMPDCIESTARLVDFSYLLAMANNRSSLGVRCCSCGGIDVGYGKFKGKVSLLYHRPELISLLMIPHHKLVCSTLGTRRCWYGTYPHSWFFRFQPLSSG